MHMINTIKNFESNSCARKSQAVAHALYTAPRRRRKTYQREQGTQDNCVCGWVALFAFFQLSSVSSFKLQAFMIFPRQRTIHANMSHIKLAC